LKPAFPNQRFFADRRPTIKKPRSRGLKQFFWTDDDNKWNTHNKKAPLKGIETFVPIVVSEVVVEPTIKKPRSRGLKLAVVRLVRCHMAYPQ